jgi:cytochrome P450
MATTDGPQHHERRRTLAQAFTADRVPRYGADIVKLTAESLAGWTDGEIRSLHGDMLELSLRIASHAFLGVDPGPATRDLVASADVLAGLSGLASMPRAESLARLPFGASRRFRDSRDALRRGVDRLIEVHADQASGEVDPDVMCLVAEQARVAHPAIAPAWARDEAMTMLMAGHVTIGSALAWTLWLLGRDRAWASRVRAEIAATLDGRFPTAADVPSMPIVRAALAEAMRLYPPAWAIGREVTEPIVVGGRRLVCGTVVIVSPWVLGRDPRWFSDAAWFDPGRWLDERTAAVPRHAYVPFGVGPRRCLGESFAWQEGILVLATILRDWDLEPLHDVPPRPRAEITLSPSDGAPMRVRRLVQGGDYGSGQGRSTIAKSMTEPVGWPAASTPM